MQATAIPFQPELTFGASSDPYSSVPPAGRPVPKAQLNELGRKSML
jgi:hypothetical protein